MLKRILRKLYRIINPLPRPPAPPPPSPPTPLFDGAYSRRWWEIRDELNGSSAQGYWDGRTHPGRKMIAEAVSTLPASSVLEVGVHAGPTLWAIAQCKEYEKLAGTELSDSVLSFAKTHLPQALGREVELVKAAADSLPFPDKSFDVTVTNLVLVCIGPDDIEASLKEMLRVTRGYLVLGEPQVASAPADKIDPYPNTTYWIRNYTRWLGDRASLVSRIPVPKESQFGHLDEIAVFAVT